MGGGGRGRAGPLPLDVRGLDALTARALGIPDGGALLARPDGVPAGWWPHADGAAAGLRAAVHAARSGGSPAEPAPHSGLGHEVARPRRVGLAAPAHRVLNAPRHPMGSR